MTAMPLIILATRNPGKLKEIREILRDVPVAICSPIDHPGAAQVPEIEETGDTLEENALIKARTVWRITGLPAISDDSGLEVDFLGGAPGVISARYAGENVTYDDNNRKLLAGLATAGEGERRAKFRCVAAYAGPRGEHTVEGRCAGRIAFAGRGSNGFGYDPLFIPDGYDRTFAELPPPVKNSISHRSEAFRRLGEYLRSIYPIAQAPFA
jgi:non-canonical purine NTP pyrophosphatase (RdgB/HAM1 family)